MPIDRRALVAVIAIASLCAAAPAGAAVAPVPFDAAAFAAARAAGRPILIEITAPWCPTCKAQKPILTNLFGQARFKDLQVFEVDFDSRMDVVRSLGATMQSTLIAYRGEREVGRSVGDTRAGAIEALLAATL